MRRLARVAQAALGALLLLGLWELLGATGALGQAFPAPTAVWNAATDPRVRSILADATWATAISAMKGMAIGAGTGIALAAFRQTFAPMRAGWDRFAVTVHAIPQIGLAPVLAVTVGRSTTPMTVAAIAAFFPAYAAATRAFASATQTQQDLFTAFGSGPWSRLTRLQLPVAVPGLLDAMRLAAPGAVLGAVLGEWFGAPKGIGLVILSSSQNYQIPQLWAAATIATLLTLIGYLLFTGLQVIARLRFQ